ncbi:MAG: Ldh family oxidoreductase [Roseibium sp.]
MTTFGVQDLEAYATSLLSAGGYSLQHAAQTARVLVWANARGADSHGVLRIPRYVEMVEQGTINPVAELAVDKQIGAISILEANRAPGASSMVRAMDEAVDQASRFGIGWCSARNITHAGAIGYYAQKAAERGYIGIVMTASGPLMAYHGSRVSGVSTNPISIAAPSSGLPLLLDMSTSTVALGKIMVAKDVGKAIPEGWGIDEEGLPTTDPTRVSTLTPLGGPKGSGLSLMIEVLSSVLVSNSVISKVLEGGGPAMNGLALALNIELFSDLKTFRNEIDRVANNIRGLPAAAGTDAILMPGERGFRTEELRMRTGIPLADGTRKRLEKLADRYGITPLQALDRAEASPS